MININKRFDNKNKQNCITTNVNGTTYNIEYVSKGASETSFYIKELDLLIDAGQFLNINIDNILITHQHLDHIKNLGSMVINLRRIKDGNYVNVLIPKPKKFVS